MARRANVLWIVAAMMANSAAIAGDSFRELQVVHRCEVVRRLEQIYTTGDPKSERNRYLAVSPANRPQHYVQCIFHDVNTEVYCEAASGFYLTKPNEPRRFRVSAATMAALTKLGFDTDDSAGNFKIERAVGKPADFNALADFILRALHDGYGVRAGVALKFNAPFAPDTPTSCVPMS